MVPGRETKKSPFDNVKQNPFQAYSSGSFPENEYQSGYSPPPPPRFGEVPQFQERPPYAQPPFSAPPPPAYSELPYQAVQPPQQMTMSERDSEVYDQYAPMARTAEVAVPCSPLVIRPTMNQFPQTAQLKSRAHASLGIAIQSQLQLDQEIPVVGMSTEIIRCTGRDCRAYINPFVTWERNGRRWICNIC